MAALQIVIFGVVGVLLLALGHVLGYFAKSGVQCEIDEGLGGDPREAVNTYRKFAYPFYLVGMGVLAKGAYTYGVLYHGFHWKQLLNMGPVSFIAIAVSVIVLVRLVGKKTNK